VKFEDESDGDESDHKEDEKDDEEDEPIFMPEAQRARLNPE